MNGNRVARICRWDLLRRIAGYAAGHQAHIGAKHDADRASADSATALARHGFYLQEVSHSAGINFVHQAPGAASEARTHHARRSRPWELQSSIVDFDRDGWPDIYVVNPR